VVSRSLPPPLAIGAFTTAIALGAVDDSRGIPAEAQRLRCPGEEHGEHVAGHLLCARCSSVRHAPLIPTHLIFKNPF